MNADAAAELDRDTADFPRREPEIRRPSEQGRIERKLGLALSGGGFRATLFHLGVLKRLAELDWLRDVSVLSTVSGGSVIGALYFLHLKRRLQEDTGPLSRDDYVKIVEELEADIRRTMGCNLRTRLFMNPLANLGILCLGRSLGRRMAKLYTHTIYRPVILRLFPGRSKLAREGVPLADVKVSTPAKGLKADLEAHNATASDRVPKFVLNATCVNTGRPFRFTMVEVGGPQLGYIRFDEVRLVLAYKSLLDRIAHRGGVEESPERISRRHGRLLRSRRPARMPSTEHLRWWCWVKQHGTSDPAEPGEERWPEGTEVLENSESPAIRYLAQNPDLSAKLWDAEIAFLRRAKLAAWYLRDERHWRADGLRDGYTREEHRRHFWDAISDIDPLLAEQLGKEAERDPLWAVDFEQFVLVLYYLRSAEVFAWTVEQTASKLTLADAVAASANFPPVFLPYRIFGLYSSARIRDLALTDGGVYDNQGIDALLEEQCTIIIASDAGALMQEEENTPDVRLPMMARIVDAMASHVRDLQLSSLREIRRVTQGMECVAGQNPDPRPIQKLRDAYRLQGLAFFHIASNPSDAPLDDALPPHPHAKAVAELRTDLDSFNEIEMDALVYQGYQLCDRFARHYLATQFSNDLGSPSPPKAPSAISTGAELAREERALRLGHARIFRLFRMKRWPLAACGMVLAIVAMVFVVRSGVSVSSAGTQLGTRVADWLGWPLSLVLDHPLQRPSSLLWSIVFLAVLISLWIGWPSLERRLARGFARLFGGAPSAQGSGMRVASRIGLWRPNLFWLAGLLPLVAALAGSSLAVLMWLTDRLGCRLGRRR